MLPEFKINLTKDIYTPLKIDFPSYLDYISKLKYKTMGEKTDWANKQKLKFDDSEYFINDLPKEAKQLVMGLRTADAQTKMYEDTLKLIALGKNKMAEDLKMILGKIEPIKNA